VRTDAINFTPKAFANSSPGFALDSGSASDSLVRTKSTIHEVQHAPSGTTTEDENLVE